jgi:hypothetical protein
MRQLYLPRRTYIKQGCLMALFSVPTQSQTKPEEGKTTYDEHLFRIIDEGALIHYCKR